MTGAELLVGPQTMRQGFTFWVSHNRRMESADWNRPTNVKRGFRMSERLSAADQDKLSDDQFAFPEQRKEPLVDASHVRNAIARFDQVEGVSDAERDRAWKRIAAAAKRFGVEMSEESWRDLRHGGEPLKKT